MRIQWLPIVCIAGLMNMMLPVNAADNGVEVTFGFHNRGGQHWRGGTNAACAGTNSLKNPLVDRTELAEASVYPGTAISTGDLVEEWNCPGAGASRLEVMQLWRPGAVTLQLLDGSNNVLAVLTDVDQVYPSGQGFGTVKKIRGTATIAAAPKGNKGAFAKVKATILSVVLTIELRDDEPVIDPRANSQDASGLDMSTLSVTLNGNAVPTNIMTISDITSATALVGKKLLFAAPCSFLTLPGHNEVKANISDKAGNAMDNVTTSFTLP